MEGDEDMDWADRIRVAREAIRQAEWEYKLAVVDARTQGVPMKRIREETGVAESTTIKYEREVASFRLEHGTGQNG